MSASLERAGKDMIDLCGRMVKIKSSTREEKPTSATPVRAELLKVAERERTLKRDCTSLSWRGKVTIDIAQQRRRLFARGCCPGTAPLNHAPAPPFRADTSRPATALRPRRAQETIICAANLRRHRPPDPKHLCAAVLRNFELGNWTSALTFCAGAIHRSVCAIVARRRPPTSCVVVKEN
ncbi:hypothetical protein B0H16DRAFT_1477253 [Mycena metata]|uniref:Uncharacterized protein n=1 Tax=Mycena metata TaxID=1033252 RepID=A0AAD7HA63_9AGAR|nr:hypothetical protein B0H16DRAFT_1477253 [Mycena metata]